MKKLLIVLFFLIGMINTVDARVRYTSSAYAPAYGYVTNTPSATISSQYFPENTTVTPPASPTYPVWDTSSAYQYYNPTYVYPSYLPYTSGGSRYPGCSRSDIVVGGQTWASCNAQTRRVGSDTVSGWFFSGDMYSVYESSNGIGNTLTWKGRSLVGRSWTLGPCAPGYRLPTRGEWETAVFYARQNNVLLASLLSLPYNGGLYGYRDRANNVTVDARVDVGGAYWTSTTATDTPIVLHLGSNYAGYRTDGTDILTRQQQYRWQYGEEGLELVPGVASELANVRCIKDTSR